MITLQEQEPENWQTELSVSVEQQKYVDSPERILQDGRTNQENTSYVYFIMKDSTPVGMVYFCDFPELNAYNLCQFFIDQRYQRKGYAKEALSLVLDLMRKDGKYPQVYVSYISGNEAACKLYESLGFTHTGYVFEDTIDMRRDL